MSKLDELIQQLCSDGVEYKPLYSVTNLKAGDRITKAQMDENHNYSVYGGGTVPTGKYSDYNFEKSITISRAGSAGFVNWVEEKFWATDVCFVATEKLNGPLIKYVYYVVKNNQDTLKRKVYGGNLPKLNKDFLWNLPIPIPPLPVQEEIVRILDNFTELTAELTARKKQYEYYRDALLTFNKNVEYIKISDTDLVNIKRGIRVVKGQLSDKNHIPVFQNSLTPLGFHDRYNVNSDTTFVIVAGAAGEIGFSDVNFWAADDCFYFETSKGYLNKFLYYVLMKNKLVLQSKVRKASIPRLSRIAIEQVQIPIISLKEQQRIVDILDRFDKLCNDISEGLPAEIEARQKQYEYYRDKLLTFKPLEEVK